MVSKTSKNLRMYLYSNNSFPFEAKVRSIYIKYHFYNKQHCIEYINTLNPLYILTSCLLNLVIQFDIILPSVSVSS